MENKCVFRLLLHWKQSDNGGGVARLVLLQTNTRTRMIFRICFARIRPRIAIRHILWKYKRINLNEWMQGFSLSLSTSLSPHPHNDPPQRDKDTSPVLIRSFVCTVHVYYYDRNNDKNSSSNNGKTMLDLLMMIPDAGRVDWLMTRGLSSGGRHCIVSIAHSVNCEWLHANNEEESSHCWVCQKLLLPRHQLTNEWMSEWMNGWWRRTRDLR